MSEKEENIQKEEKVEDVNEIKNSEIFEEKKNAEEEPSKTNVKNEETEKIVEQLDDVEFEKEQKEKSKKSKKKNIIFLIIGILVIIAIGLSAFFFINKGNPTDIIQDFVTSFNSQDFETTIDMIDIKGYYALATTSEGEEIDENTNYEKFYTKFDERYEKSEKEDDYKELLEVIEEIDAETLKTLFNGMEIKITEIEDPVLIQNTKGLYKISANIDVIYEGETQSDQYNFYVNKEKVNLIKSEYKLVGGELPETILYMMFLSEYYSNL